MERALKLFLTPTVVHLPTHSHLEKWISGLGGFLGIALTVMLSRFLLGDHVAVQIVASMGASAVLLYAVPHSAFSSPWAVLGGHCVSALVGVILARLVPDPLLATPLAVGLAITAQYYLRCIHPPGGATAFFAVMGGPAVRALGFNYVFFPVMLNALIILSVAVIFNKLLRARQDAHVRALESHLQVPEKCFIRHSDLVYALSEIQSYIDVGEEDLMHIYKLAVQHAFPSTAVQH
ncbi:MAG: HPP family protein [Betaproteobacteria bacterium]|nr:HPP family protein [Betaproteobacteria bacterium]